MTDKTHPNETTAKQVAANRKNAEHSTGPRSRAGKEAAALNALRTGLYAEHPVAIRTGVFKEDEEAVEQYLARIIASQAPRDDLEFDQARRVAFARLKFNRLDGYASYVVAAAGTIDDPTPRVNASIGSSTVRCPRSSLRRCAIRTGITITRS